MTLSKSGLKYRSMTESKTERFTDRKIKELETWFWQSTPNNQLAFRLGYQLSATHYQLFATPRHSNFKELVGFYMNGGKDFVSGKQKSAIFELFCFSAGR